MATTVWIVDSSFKRTQLKVTPGKYLREVLEEACKSRKLNPEEYTLKTQNNKALDLSQPFRLSGLSAGAKLQLTQARKSLGVVSVALQLPESASSATPPRVQPPSRSGQGLFPAATRRAAAPARGLSRQRSAYISPILAARARSHREIRGDGSDRVRECCGCGGVPEEVP